jgi:uncharacterized protein (TIRG00374 family)
MSTSTLKNWKFWAGIAISAIFLGVAFHGVNFSELKKAVSHVSLFWVILGIGAYYLNLFIRAWRWGYIYRHVKRVKLWTMTGATIVGYFANNVLPFRLGEVARAIYIGEKERTDKSASLATIVVEGLFDSLSALVILALTFSIYPFPSHLLGEWGGYFRDAGIGLVALSAVGFSVLIFMVAKRDLTIKVAEKLIKPLPQRAREKSRKAVFSFIDGLKILTSPIEVLALVGMSAVVWGSNLLPVYLSGLAFEVPGLKFDLPETMLVLVSGMVAAAIPASPGFVGTFHFANKMVVMLVLAVKWSQGGFSATGIEQADFGDWALSYSVIVHALYILTTTITGALILAYSGITLAKLKQNGTDEL